MMIYTSDYCTCLDTICVSLLLLTIIVCPLASPALPALILSMPTWYSTEAYTIYIVGCTQVTLHSDTYLGLWTVSCMWEWLILMYLYHHSLVWFQNVLDELSKFVCRYFHLRWFVSRETIGQTSFHLKETMAHILFIIFFNFIYPSKNT